MTKKLITLSLLFSLIALNTRAQCSNTGTLTVHVIRSSDSLEDQTVVGFDPCSTDSYSNTYDANKVLGAANRPSLYTINGGQLMAINIMNSVATVPTVPMGLVPGGTGQLTMTFTITNFDSATPIFVQDSQFNNLWHDARSGNYVFNADSTENPNRFVIHFTGLPTGIENIAEDEPVSIYPNPVSTGSWKLIVGNDLIGAPVVIFDVNGKMVYAGEIKNTHSEIEAPPAGGIYLLRINSDKSSIVRKLVRL